MAFSTRQTFIMRPPKLWPNQWLYLAFFVVIMGAMLALSNYHLVNLICSSAFSIIFADICAKTYEAFVYKRKFLDAKEKAVFVTGCDTGFGLVFAQRLSQIGFLVYASVLNPKGDGAKTLQTFDNVIIVSLDVTDQTSVDNAVEFVKADLKEKGNRTLWSLVNNAGVSVYCNVEMSSLDHYQRLMDVNAFGVVRMCKAFLPLMRAAGGGRIVNICSQSGKNTLPCMTAYSMSKSALSSFSNGLRIEMKPWNISVHTVVPSFYLTVPTFDEIAKPFRESYLKLWNSCPAEVKQSYGEAYIYDFIRSFTAFVAQLQRPREKLYEVIDDLAHAVAGIDPNVEYTPGTATKMGSKILSFMPREVADIFLTPEVRELPAAVALGRAEARKHD